MIMEKERRSKMEISMDLKRIKNNKSVMISPLWYCRPPTKPVDEAKLNLIGLL